MDEGLEVGIDAEDPDGIQCVNCGVWGLVACPIPILRTYQADTRGKTSRKDRPGTRLTTPIINPN